jgi:hypothetical protein
MMLLAPRAFVWGAFDEATWGNGLEADSTTSLKVLIEEMSEEAKNIGLTRERIEARVNQSLRKAGITPVSAQADDYLYVNVNTLDSSFSISISFERRIFYRSGGKWFTTIGSTWHRSGTGIAQVARAARGADYILDRIAEYVEVFCNEFLKANGK